jgi:hypothetical protein
MMNKNLLFCLFLLISRLTVGQLPWYQIDDTKMNKSIPSPEKFLGNGVGDQHTRHEKLAVLFTSLMWYPRFQNR